MVKRKNKNVAETHNCECDAHRLAAMTGAPKQARLMACQALKDRQEKEAEDLIGTISSLATGLMNDIQQMMGGFVDTSFA